MGWLEVTCDGEFRDVVQGCNLRSDSAIKRRSGTYWAIAGIRVSREELRRVTTLSKGDRGWAELLSRLVTITITPASLRIMPGPSVPTHSCV